MDVWSVLAGGVGAILATVTALYAQRRNGKRPKQSRRSATVSIVVAALLIIASFLALLFGSSVVSVVALVIALGIASLVVFSEKTS